MSTFFDVPELFRFKAATMPQLQTFLERQRRDTEFVPIARLEDVQITRTGSTVGAGYRYTRAAFATLCKTLTQGLFRLVSDLSGARDPTDSLNLRAARWIFNESIALRFDRLSQWSLLRDRGTKHIDGFRSLARNDAFWSGPEFLELCQNALSPRLQFYGGTLLSRDLATWWRAESPLCVCHTSRPIMVYRGMVCDNSETVGNGVHAHAALFTPYGVALVKARDGFLQRCYRNHRLRAELPGYLTSLAEFAFPEDLERRITRSLSRPLLDDWQNTEGYEAAKQQWISRLSRWRLSRGVASTVLQTAIMTGVDGTPVPVFDEQGVARSRNRDALFASLCRVARTMDMRRRVLVERAAYHLLVS
jgi:hypothetical protein